MDKLLFKGIKQVTREEYNNISSSNRIGYLWFVREFSGDSVTSSDIFFGNRRYGHSGKETEDIIALSGAVITISEELGNLGLAEGETLADIIETVFGELDKKIEGVTINGIEGEEISGISTFSIDSADIPYSASTVSDTLTTIIERLNSNLVVIFEQPTEETIAEGHIELKLNDNSEIYGVMYYQE